MENQFNTQRTTAERVVIGVLILLGTAILIGIQSLFLNHIYNALPQDPMWRLVTVACFLAPPVSFAFLVLLKMNYSRSAAQDYILIAGMLIELLLFALNMIVAVNANEISGTMLGMIGVLLGGIAGLVSAGTTALCLAADPLRGITKSRVEHELKVAKDVQKKTEGLITSAMSSDRVQAVAEQWAEEYTRGMFGSMLHRRLGDARRNSDTDFLAEPPNVTTARANGHSQRK